MIIENGIYTHFKGGEYEVIGIAIHSETMERMVIYREMYGDGKLWTRPATMWLEEIEYKGSMVKRFTQKN